MNPTPPNQKNKIVHSDIHADGNLHVGDSTTYNNYFQGQKVTIPRHLTNSIPRNADHVLGRDKELAAIATQLANNRATVLVNGIGGMGKTSVAAKYIVQQYGHYAHIAWLTVSGTIEETFINNTVLLAALHITKNVQELVEGKNIRGAFELVFKKLNDLTDTLVVLDNANVLEDLLQHKNLFDNAHCHILLTSRTLPQAWQIVQIKPLPNEIALEVFRRHAPSVAPDPKGEQKAHEGVPVSDKDLLKLLKHLDFHTLLIELVAKSAQASAIPFATLQDIIQKQFIHNPLLSKRKVETGTHGISVEDNAQRAKVEDYIWLIFENIADISTEAKEILKAIALLPVATPYDDDFLETHIQSFGIESDVIEILDNLVERGWLEPDKKDGKPAYKLHTLIADVVIKHLGLTVEFAEAYIIRVANLIYYDAQDPKHNLFKINENRPLAERLSDLFFDENTEGVSYLLDRLGYLEENFGFYKKAAEYGERALQIAESIFDKNHKTIAARQSNLANVYQNLGKYEEAAALLETALVSDLTNFGQEHPYVALRKSNLAAVYWSLGKYEQAEVFWEATLESDMKFFGQEHPKTAMNKSNLAVVYQSLGKYEQAAALLETALASDLKNFSTEHPEIAVRQNNLANVYRDLGKNEQAAVLLETALASDLKNFGEEHPNVARCQWNLAWVYIKTDRKHEAKVLLLTAYQNFLKNLGAEHPRTVAVQSSLRMWSDPLSMGG
jgi:tetratricopeptide (TPR) repeat protein